jgi:hypothetical protein
MPDTTRAAAATFPVTPVRRSMIPAARRPRTLAPIIRANANILRPSILSMASTSEAVIEPEATRLRHTSSTHCRSDRPTPTIPAVWATRFDAPVRATAVSTTNSATAAAPWISSAWRVVVTRWSAKYRATSASVASAPGPVPKAASPRTQDPT